MSDGFVLRATRDDCEPAASGGNEVVVVVADPSPALAPGVSVAVPMPETDLRWSTVGAVRRNWRGGIVSIGIHLGTVALAAGLLVETQDGGAKAGPQAIEIELLSADEFDSLSSRSGASGAKSASSDVKPRLPEATQPETPRMSNADAPPREAPPVIQNAATETFAPDTTGPADPPDAPPLAAENQTLGIVPENTTPTPSESSDPQPVAPQAKAAERARSNPPPLPAPRPVKVERTKPSTRKAARPHPRMEARGKTGDGAEALSRAAAVRGATGRADSAGVGITDSFRARVMAHLLRHKRYPEAARDRGIRGRVLVTFSFGANGEVTAVSLNTASGSALLDSEAIAMVRRASPFPPIPPEAGRVQAAFTAPIVYNMN